MYDIRFLIYMQKTKRKRSTYEKLDNNNLIFVPVRNIFKEYSITDNNTAQVIAYCCSLESIIASLWWQRKKASIQQYEHALSLLADKTIQVFAFVVKQSDHSEGSCIEDGSFYVLQKRNETTNTDDVVTRVLQVFYAKNNVSGWFLCRSADNIH